MTQKGSTQSTRLRMGEYGESGSTEGPNLGTHVYTSLCKYIPIGAILNICGALSTEEENARRENSRSALGELQ